MLVWMNHSGSFQSLYLEVCLNCTKGYREADEELIRSCGFLTVVDYGSNGLQQKMLFGS